MTKFVIFVVKTMLWYWPDSGIEVIRLCGFKMNAIKWQ